MKKVVLSLAFVAAVLVSCNKKAEETPAADSTAVDTTAVAADTTAALCFYVCGCGKEERGETEDVFGGWGAHKARQHAGPLVAWHCSAAGDS